MHITSFGKGPAKNTLLGITLNVARIFFRILLHLTKSIEMCKVIFVVFISLQLTEVRISTTLVSYFDRMNFYLFRLTIVEKFVLG